MEDRLANAQDEAHKEQRKVREGGGRVREKKYKLCDIAQHKSHLQATTYLALACKAAGAIGHEASALQQESRTNMLERTVPPRLATAAHTHAHTHTHALESAWMDGARC